MGYRPRSHGSDWKTPALLIGGALLVLVLTILGLYFWLKSDTGRRMWLILQHNFLFWILLFGGAAWAGFCKWKWRDEFTWGEVAAQAYSSLVFLFILSNAFTACGSNVMDFEYWNSHVTGAVYEESYDETEAYQHCTTESYSCQKTYSCTRNGMSATCTRTGTCTRQKCVTKYRCVTRGPSWSARNAIGESYGLSPGEFRNIRNRFDNYAKSGSQGNSCAGSRGYIWKTRFDGKPSRMIPTVSRHKFINFLLVSSTIRRKGKSAKKGYEAYLKPYPKIYNNGYGRFSLDRVIVAKAKVPSKWKRAASDALGAKLAILGPKRHVNAYIYIVGTSQKKAAYAVEAHWVGGKKNDVTLIIGASRFPAISWVHVMSWTKNEMFKVKLRRRVRELKTLANAAALVEILADQIDKPKDQGGFERLRMKSMEYLAAEVKIAWWATALILFLYLLLVGLMTLGFHRNSIRN